jgi:hypothetical protein
VLEWVIVIKWVTWLTQHVILPELIVSVQHKSYYAPKDDPQTRARDNRRYLCSSRQSDYRDRRDLGTRGWAFQERHLTRRIVSITNNGLYWDCLCHSASHRMPIGIPRDISPLSRNGDEMAFTRCLLNPSLSQPSQSDCRFVEIGCTEAGLFGRKEIWRPCLDSRIRKKMDKQIHRQAWLLAHTVPESEKFSGSCFMPGSHHYMRTNWHVKCLEDVQGREAVIEKLVNSDLLRGKRSTCRCSGSPREFLHLVGLPNYSALVPKQQVMETGNSSVIPICSVGAVCRIFKHAE